MPGAIAGDIMGSVYEGKTGWMPARTPRFKPPFHPRCRFRDGTVPTIAVAEGILHGGDRMFSSASPRQSTSAGSAPPESVPG